MRLLPKKGLARAATLGAAIAVVGTAAGVATAGAATLSPAPVAGSPVTGCINGNAEPYSSVPYRGIWEIYTNNASKPTCPKGSWKTSIASESQLNNLNSQVQANTGAIQNLQNSKVGTATPKNLLSAPESVPTGGSFSANKTLVGTVQLSQGTYLVHLGFMATPNTSLSNGQVFPQMFVYNGAQVSGFSNDLFNIGSGALENPTSAELSGKDVIDSYYSGSDLVTVPAGGETLDFYAFGYDSDTSAGSYLLDTATVTTVQLTG